MPDEVPKELSFADKLRHKSGPVYQEHRAKHRAFTQIMKIVDQCKNQAMANAEAGSTSATLVLDRPYAIKPYVSEEQIIEGLTKELAAEGLISKTWIAPDQGNSTMQKLWIRVSWGEDNG